MGTVAAALTALLMLSYASITSIVMQVAMGSPAAAEPTGSGLAGAMAGMSMPGAQGTQAHTPRSRLLAKPNHAKPNHAKPGHAKPAHAKSAACPYCAVAGHLPVLGGVTPFQAPTTFSFAAFRVAAGDGARGPPAFQPRARGPPADSSSL